MRRLTQREINDAALEAYFASVGAPEERSGLSVSGAILLWNRSYKLFSHDYQIGSMFTEVFFEDFAGFIADTLGTTNGFVLRGTTEALYPFSAVPEEKHSVIAKYFTEAVLRKYPRTGLLYTEMTRGKIEGGLRDLFERLFKLKNTFFFEDHVSGLLALSFKPQPLGCQFQLIGDWSLLFSHHVRHPHAPFFIRWPYRTTDLFNMRYGFALELSGVENQDSPLLFSLFTSGYTRK